MDNFDNDIEIKYKTIQTEVKGNKTGSRRDKFYIEENQKIKNNKLESRDLDEKQTKDLNLVADEWVGPDRWIARTLNIGDEL